MYTSQKNMCYFQELPKGIRKIYGMDKSKFIAVCMEKDMQIMIITIVMCFVNSQL